MSLMEKFADPELFDSLSFGEKMGGSAITMLMGMGITFIILCLLWGFVAIMGNAMGAGRKAAQTLEGAETSAVPSAAAAVTSDSAETASSAADDEIIAAVIAAAVAAYHESGGTGNLVVKKISRISGGETAWMNNAKKECLESRTL